MRSTRPGWLSVWVCCLALICAVARADHGAQEGITQISHAAMRVEPHGPAQTVALPLVWDSFRPGVSGRVVLDMEFEAQPTSPLGSALVVYRIGNGYKVWVNDVLLDQFGDLDRHFSTDSKLPRLIPIATPLLQHNRLRVELRADTGRQATLSRIDVLPMDEARMLLDGYWRVRVLLRQSVLAFSALVGMIGLALWLTQTTTDEQGARGRERLYLYGGLAEMAWVLRISDGLIEVPPLPLPLWSVVASVSLGVWASLTLLFCAEVIGWGQHPRMKPVRATLVLMVLTGVGCAAAAWMYRYPPALTAWYMVLGLCFLTFGLIYLCHAMGKAGNLQSRLLAGAIVTNVLMGLVDLFQQRIAPSASAGAYLYTASVLFGVAAGITVLMRFRAVSRQAQQLTRHLSAMVQQKEEELRQSYLRMGELAQDQARLQERTRVLRDLHDGVGAHLSVAMRQLQAGNVAREQVLLTLRDSMDHLKLSIDSINLPPGDVGMVLANVRYRFEARLREAGITLGWHVESIEPLQRLCDKGLRDLQYITYGVLSNVLQHAGATRLDVHASEAQGVVLVGFVDNGVGFNAQAPLRSGLQSLVLRAAALGGALQIHSSTSGTRVELQLPRGV